MWKVYKYTLIDLARNKFVLGWTLLLLAISLGLFQLEDQPVKSMLSLSQVLLALVPLVASVFTIVYLYDAMEFTELLAVQPLRRSKILGGQMGALGTALVLGALVGAGIPLMLFLPGGASLTLLLACVMLTLVFVAIGSLIAIKNREKARGVGLGLVVWFLFVLVYDAVLLWVMFAFSDYPIEPWIVPLAALDPIDLGRIMVLLKVDLAAMMGYSGAVYEKFFGNVRGILVALAALIAWVALPSSFAFRAFRRKDL
ncbi:MAG: ABC transporter permease [Flavobacteriales bacterium]|jgi:Cu-processing system permease protein|nr:ABC transporter permease [Flavobacteriales bacterium]MBK6892819.1 ABC transporter permease [Flavobacteriales bacterium]MBK7246964.1 ABC transporter permease [Flavobacteriales bacterium]MBK7287335.1 ABC transporter permease [Flavobacteriales bacterium]MBK9061557.1 ABC transporter permease [Flavobacteriales bacterium]